MGVWRDKLSYSDHQNLQHQLFRIRFTELNEIFAVMSLRSFVCSLIGIFGPIYLYILGYSFRDIIIMHLAMFSVEFAFEYITARLISRFGPKHTMALSMIFLVAHYWMLWTVQSYGWPLWLIGMMGGIHLALYWQSYHYDFSRSKHKREATEDVSKLYIMLALLGAIAPFIGGVISTHYGFSPLYIIVIFSLMFVMFPLLKSGEKHVPKSFSLAKLTCKPSFKDMVSYGGYGIEASTSLVAWPLFAFLIVGTTQNVGLVTSLALVFTITITYMVGKKVNDGNRHEIIKIGSLLDGLVYALLVFVETFMQILSLNFVRSIVSSFRSAPFVSEYYLHADEQNRAEYIFIMESTIDVFKIIMYLALFGLSYFYGLRELLVIALLFGAMGSLLAGFMPRAKCELPYCKDAKIKLIPKLRVKNAID